MTRGLKSDFGQFRFAMSRRCGDSLRRIARGDVSRAGIGLDFPAPAPGAGGAGAIEPVPS